MVVDAFECSIEWIREWHWSVRKWVFIDCVVFRNDVLSLCIIHALKQTVPVLCEAWLNYVICAWHNQWRSCTTFWETKLLGIDSRAVYKNTNNDETKDVSQDIDDKAEAVTSQTKFKHSSYIVPWRTWFHRVCHMCAQVSPIGHLFHASLSFLVAWGRLSALPRRKRWRI